MSLAGMFAAADLTGIKHLGTISVAGANLSGIRIDPDSPLPEGCVRNEATGAVEPVSPGQAETDASSQ